MNRPSMIMNFLGTFLSLVAFLLLADIAKADQSAVEMLREVNRTCDGVSNLVVSGQRANIEVRKGLEVNLRGDNSVEIRKDGVLVEKFTHYTAEDRQKCIDSLLQFLRDLNESENPLLRAARGNSVDGSVLIKKVKIDLVKVSPASSITLAKSANLIFSFDNQSSQRANISGVDRCNLVKWQLPYGSNGKRITKTATLEQNGSSVISVDPGKTKKIRYTIILLDRPAYQEGGKEESLCHFFISFGPSAMLHRGIAIANSPMR
jgi:hypothetical protein